jgi:hypothetical protein
VVQNLDLCTLLRHDLAMVFFIPQPGSDEFLYAANDNGEHRSPDFRFVMKAGQRLAQVEKQLLAAVVRAHNS